jgi:hypothetical protein
VVPGREQLEQTPVLGVGDGLELAVEPLLKEQQEPVARLEQPVAHEQLPQVHGRLR